MRYKEWRKQRIREQLHAQRDRSFDPVFQDPPPFRYLTDEEEAQVDQQAEQLAAAFGPRTSVAWARHSILSALGPEVRSAR